MQHTSLEKGPVYALCVLWKSPTFSVSTLLRSTLPIPYDYLEMQSCTAHQCNQSEQTQGADTRAFRLVLQSCTANSVLSYCVNLPTYLCIHNKLGSWQWNAYHITMILARHDRDYTTVSRLKNVLTAHYRKCPQYLNIIPNKENMQ